MVKQWLEERGATASPEEETEAHEHRSLGGKLLKTLHKSHSSTGASLREKMHSRKKSSLDFPANSDPTDSVAEKGVEGDSKPELKLSNEANSGRGLGLELGKDQPQRHSFPPVEKDSSDIEKDSQGIDGIEGSESEEGQIYRTPQTPKKRKSRTSPKPLRFLSLRAKGKEEPEDSENQSTSPRRLSSLRDELSVPSVLRGFRNRTGKKELSTSDGNVRLGDLRGADLTRVGSAPDPLNRREASSDDFGREKSGFRELGSRIKTRLKDGDHLGSSSLISSFRKPIESLKETVTGMSFGASGSELQQNHTQRKLDY